MNQVAGPFAPQQPAGFAFNPAYPQHQHQGLYAAAPSSASPQHSGTPSQAFASAPPAGYNNVHHGGTAMAPTGGYVIGQPPPPPPQQYPYTTATYSQSLLAQAPTALVASPHNLIRPHQSASPPQRQSPHVGTSTSTRTTPQPPVRQPILQSKQPMAAPPVPHSSVMSSNTHNTPTASSKSPTPPSPGSPGSGTIEHQRAALLLDINLSLLQEVSALQAAGKGGATSPQQAAQLIAQGQPGDLAAPEYIDVLRRVQANIAYLAPRASGDTSKMVKGPAHMTPPAHMPQLQAKYDRLRELFPGWVGYDLRQQLQAQQQGAQLGAPPRPNGVSAPGAPAQA